MFEDVTGLCEQGCPVKPTKKAASQTSRRTIALLLHVAVVVTSTVSMVEQWISCLGDCWIPSRAALPLFSGTSTGINPNKNEVSE